MDHALSIAVQEDFNVNSRGDDNLEAFAEFLDVPYEFRRQPTLVPAALLPSRRIPLILLIVARSRGSRASWKVLQVLNWAVRDPVSAELLVGLLHEARDAPHLPVVRIEPAFDRALDLAVGLGLLTQPKPRIFQLTAPGRSVVTLIEASSAFSREKAILEQLDKGITQKQINMALEWRST